MKGWIIPAALVHTGICRTKDKSKWLAHDKKHDRLILRETPHGFGIHPRRARVPRRDPHLGQGKLAH
jgi:hypothetical protein